MTAATGLSEQAYEQLKAAILRGELGPGEALAENRLAQMLGMSRTPVREALKVLARDGFLESLPSRGFAVPRRSLDDLRQLFELRESLEGMAARCAALRASPAEVEQLEQLCSRYEAAREWAEWVRIGTEFHSRIHQLSRNRRLVDFLESLKAQIVLARQEELRQVKQRRDEAVAEHRAILDAIRSRDPEGAEESARRHVRKSYELALRGFHVASLA